MSRFAFVAALICAAPAFADTRFFSAIDDLPLPPGFTERDASTFDGQGGRIVLAGAEGAMAAAAVRDFYYASLPQLGWSVSPQSDGALVFLRGRERLSFTVMTQNGRTRLGARLAILPEPSSAD